MAAAFKTSLFCAASLALFLVTPTLGQFNHLLAGERLKTGEALWQTNYKFIIQGDCNLVLYEFEKPIWASGTNGKGTNCYATMQRDGNLVVYDYKNKPIWASNTNRENGNYILILQKDRNVVIYSLPIWNTGTYQYGSGVVVAAARNGTVGVSGAEQNKVREMANIVEVV